MANIKNFCSKAFIFPHVAGLSFYSLKIIVCDKICLPKFSIKKLICKLQEDQKVVVYMFDTKENTLKMYNLYLVTAGNIC